MNDRGELRETARRLARGADLLEIPLVLQKYGASDLIVSSRPTLGGLVVSEPYRGQSFDPGHARVVKGGWDHEHCTMCWARVLPGDEWWAASPPDQAGLCPGCHALLDRSRDDLRSIVQAEPGGGRRSARKQASMMTEADWLTSTIPLAMLKVLEGRAKAGEIDGKLRLFSCACVRHVWHLLEDERSRKAIEVAERYADGLAEPEELDASGFEAGNAASDLYVSGGLQAADEARIAGLEAGESPTGAVIEEKPEARAWTAARAAANATERKIGISGTGDWYEGAWIAARSAARTAHDAIAESARLRAREAAYQATATAIEAPLSATDPIAGAAELRAREAAHRAVVEAHRFYEDPWQSDLLRCIFGNPFCPINFDPGWPNPASVAIARTLDEHRSFDRLPDLADALEEAGCREVAILGHCREPGPHARGCWVVDAVLGKS